MKNCLTSADAARRLRKRMGFERPQAAVFARGHLTAGADVAVDATGWDGRYASRHCVQRSGYKRFTRLAWPKLRVVCRTGLHLLPAAVVSHSPAQDSPQSPAVPAITGRLSP